MARTSRSHYAVRTAAGWPDWRVVPVPADTPAKPYVFPTRRQAAAVCKRMNAHEDPLRQLADELLDDLRRTCGRDCGSDRIDDVHKVLTAFTAVISLRRSA